MKSQSFIQHKTITYTLIKRKLPMANLNSITLKKKKVLKLSFPVDCTLIEMVVLCGQLIFFNEMSNSEVSALHHPFQKAAFH